jgi:hypothetical protein
MREQHPSAETTLLGTIAQYSRKCQGIRHVCAHLADTFTGGLFARGTRVRCRMEVDGEQECERGRASSSVAIQLVRDVGLDDLRYRVEFLPSSRLTATTTHVWQKLFD